MALFFSRISKELIDRVLKIVDEAQLSTVRLLALVSSPVLADWI